MSAGATRTPRALDLRAFPGVGPVAVLALVFLYVPIVVTTVSTLLSRT